MECQQPKDDSYQLPSVPFIGSCTQWYAAAYIEIFYRDSNVYNEIWLQALLRYSEPTRVASLLARVHRDKL